MRILQNKKGFTYIELIIVIAIFSIITVIVGTTFILFTRAQTKTSVREKLVADGRYIMEAMIRAVRTGEVNYDAYTSPIINPVDYLNLLDTNNQPINFQLIKGDCPIGITDCLFMENYQGGGIVSGADINIDDIQFYILPNKNPFEVGNDGAYLDNHQPEVLILLTISAKAKQGADPIRLTLQTTVSSKRYVR